MAGTIIPWFRQQWLDSSGNPLASGTLETYEAGTATPLATYSDSGLSVSNGTTITLNAGGYPQVSGVEVAIFLLPRAYKFILKNSAGVTQRTADNVYALQAASAGNLDIDGVAGVALSAGDFAYESDGSGGLIAGRWYKTDADLSYAAGAPLLAYVPSAIAQGATGTLRRGGIADNLSGLSAGSTYYLSATAGLITATAPAGYVRAVGVASSATVLTLNWAPRSGDLALSPLGLCEGRLTGTSGTPVTTADVTGATSIYYTPYRGNRIALYDGTASWLVRTFSEITISLAGLTASTPYDVFAYDNAGTVTIETLAWTNATTRATALTKQDGVYVKTGATTRRYLGTLYINSSGGQTDDAYTKRNLWNYYHRVRRPLRRLTATASWTYSTATVRQADANAANQLEVVIGVAEVELEANVSVTVANAGATNAETMLVAVGEDSTTTIATGCVFGRVHNPAANTRVQNSARLVTMPAIGRHIYVWLEWSSAGGSATTWYGANAVAEGAGMWGSVEG